MTTPTAPQPKKDIYITAPGVVGYLRITVASDNARDWIKQEAPKYGRLTHLEPEYSLVIFDNFNANEVKAWLESGGQGIV